MSGIYIHIPFCKQACFYCDFHFSTSLKKKDELINCLISEIKLRKNELNTDVIQTIYFGGGTPSLMEPKSLSIILEKIYKNFSLSKDVEISLEANPSSVEKKKFKDFS